MEPRDYLAVVNEPGSANAMAPVIAALGEAGDRVRTFASDVARPFLRRFDVESEPLPNDIVAQSFFDRPIDLVLVGTSFERTVEAQLIIEARRRGIPTLVVLDHWNNYARRFSTRNDGALDALPNLIAAMDDDARSGLVEGGVPDDRIVVTGHPYLEQLSSVDLQSREQVRSALGVSDTAFLALFASEVVGSAEDEPTAPSLEYPLFDEIRTAVEWTALALGALERKDVALVLKAHPREDSGFVAREAADLSHIVNTIPVEKGDGLSLSAAADMVVGLTSMLLIESATLGIPTLSVRSVGQRYDRFADANVGSLRSTYTLEETVGTVGQVALAAGRGPRARLARYAGATEVVVRLVGEMAANGPRHSDGQQ
jgi:hypothetical protein